jgi:hypothetical protein
VVGPPTKASIRAMKLYRAKASYPALKRSGTHSAFSGMNRETKATIRKTGTSSVIRMQYLCITGFL